MSDFESLWPGGPVFRQAAHFRLGTDTVLLADFVKAEGRRHGIDLGCASGALMLLLLARAPRLRMTGIELAAEAAERARENMAANGLEGRSEIITGDLRAHRALFAAGSGLVSADPERAAARGELTCTLADICEAASFLCRTGGSVCLVHKPERLSELFCALTAAGIEPKRLRLVCPRPAAAPSLVLVEGRRGGHPGLVIEPPLLLRDTDGAESAELRRIYRR